MYSVMEKDLYLNIFFWNNQNVIMWFLWVKSQKQICSINVVYYHDTKAARQYNISTDFRVHLLKSWETQAKSNNHEEILTFFFTFKKNFQKKVSTQKK